MKPHLFLALCLSGCAIFPPEKEYKWYQVYTRPATAYLWVVVPQEQLKNKHMMAHAEIKQTNCVIKSYFSESQAKQLIINDISLWEHEMRHCGLIDGAVWWHN